LRASVSKVQADAAGEVVRGLEVVDFACGISQPLKESQGVSSGVNVHSFRQPLGVVAGITPFNFPAMVRLWMFPSAIGCGNTFTLKPSEKDPSASVLLAELVAEACFPDGVFNVVQGDKDAVDRILTPPRCRCREFCRIDPGRPSCLRDGGAGWVAAATNWWRGSGVASLH
jgi:malonate-semialdehyde dehydrogenase (acetylating) / methylmalonate-semialdehyde dehydrogenase